MIRRPPRSTLFPTRRSSDLAQAAKVPILVAVNKVDHPNANPLKGRQQLQERGLVPDRKSTRLNSSHLVNSYAVFCFKKKKKNVDRARGPQGHIRSAAQTTRE